MERSPHLKTYANMRRRGATLQEIKQKADELGDDLSIHSIARYFKKNPVGPKAIEIPSDQELFEREYENVGELDKIIKKLDELINSGEAKAAHYQARAKLSSERRAAFKKVKETKEKYGMQTEREREKNRAIMSRVLNKIAAWLSKGQMEELLGSIREMKENDQVQ